MTFLISGGTSTMTPCRAAGDTKLSYALIPGSPRVLAQCRTRTRPAGGALDEPQRGSIRGSAVSVTGFDDARLVAKLVGEPIADEHFDVWGHSLSVRSPLRRQRHLLRLRESLWVLVIHLISPCAPKPGGYQATTAVRGITVRRTPSASVGRHADGPRARRPHPGA